MNPITVRCPACNAGPSVPCNVPTDTGRRNVQWFHHARENKAQEEELEETP